MTVNVTASKWFLAKFQSAIDQDALSAYELAADVAADAEAAIAAKTEVAALSAGPTMTYTSGSAPAVSGAVTIADSTTPTVTELLDYIVELNAKVDAITAALKA